MKLSIFNEGVGSFLAQGAKTLMDLWPYRNEIIQRYNDTHPTDNVTFGDVDGQLYRNGYRILHIGNIDLPVNRYECNNITSAPSKDALLNTIQTIVTNRRLGSVVKNEVARFFNDPKSDIPIQGGHNHMDVNENLSNNLVKDIVFDRAIDLGLSAVPVVGQAKDVYDVGKFIVTTLSDNPITQREKEQNSIYVRNPTSADEVNKVVDYSNKVLRTCNADRLDEEEAKKNPFYDEDPSYRELDRSLGRVSYSEGGGEGNKEFFDFIKDFSLQDLYNRYPSLEKTVNWLTESPAHMTAGILGTILAGYGLYKAAKAVRAFFKNRKDEADRLMAQEDLPQSKEEAEDLKASMKGDDN